MAVITTDVQYIHIADLLGFFQNILLAGSHILLMELTREETCLVGAAEVNTISTAFGQKDLIQFHNPLTDSHQAIGDSLRIFRHQLFHNMFIRTSHRQIYGKSIAQQPGSRETGDQQGCIMSLIDFDHTLGQLDLLLNILAIHGHGLNFPLRSPQTKHPSASSSGCRS